MDDELVAQFVGITNASSEKASQYLRICDNNVQQAIELFFNTGGADLGEAAGSPAQSSAQAPPVPPAHTRPGAQTDPIDLDTDEEMDTDEPEIVDVRPGGAARSSPPPAAGASATGHTQEDDETMARRLQEQFYSGADMAGDVDADGYRAPIARTRETLVGPGSYTYDDPDDSQALLDQMRRRNEPRTRGMSINTIISVMILTIPGYREAPGIFNQRPAGASPSIWNEPAESSNHATALSRATGGASEASRKSNLLAEMYRPPFEIMNRLPWDEAREEGKENKKWLLVNVQDPSIFDCQVLNRDLWKDPSIKDTIKENFIFMQYAKDDPRGAQYMQYYFQNREGQDAYPHIAIVDPRTGEQVKVWSGPPAPKPMDFLMQLHEFLDRYSLNAKAKNPVAKRKPEPKPETQVERMTEDEMLQFALKQSLAGNDTNHGNTSDPDDLTRSFHDGRSATVEADDTPPSPSKSNANGHEASPFDLISSSNPHEAPDADSNNTRIQFRHPAGRVIRRFALDDKVQRIFEWLKAEPIEGTEGKPFELVSMGTNLINKLDDTIKGAGLGGGTVMIEFVEEEK